MNFNGFNHIIGTGGYMAARGWC